MDSEQGARQRLIALVERRFFDPILKKSRGEFLGEADQATLDEVKESVQLAKERLAGLASAEQIRARYFEELLSEANRTEELRLQHLQLPTLSSLREEFVRLCDEIWSPR